jgi:hypothetical protein
MLVSLLDLQKEAGIGSTGKGEGRRTQDESRVVEVKELSLCWWRKKCVDVDSSVRRHDCCSLSWC